jgi:adenylate cyclase
MSAVLKDLASGAVFEVGAFALIGRGETATVRLADGSISRQHASIRQEDSSFWLVDLGSANGTFVNDAALTSARRLRDGDRLQFGRVVLVFEQVAAAEAFDPENAKTQISRLAPALARSVPMTLMVADLRGFTGISARLSPGELADLLREWYADCELVLRRNGASIDKFIGDCVFAYWHGIEPSRREAALAAAAELRAAHAPEASPVRHAVEQKLGFALDCRIGLHVGEVAVGSMGKGINTALGDAVNVAFRIEGLTRLVGRPALVSAAFLDGWEEARGRFDACGVHPIRGLPDPVEVFAPTGWL